MATVAQLLPYPNLTPVFLVEHTTGVWIRNWTLTSGKTVTYEVDLSGYGLDAQNEYTMVGVMEDGTSMTSRASTADVESNPGSYYFSGGILYVSSSSGTPFDNTIVATVKFYFSNVGRTHNGIYYDPRVKAVPNLSLRIERNFGDVTQIGGGSLSYINDDGWFDNKMGLQWENGTAVIKLGVDRPGLKMAYADYETIGTWIIDTWQRTDTEAGFDLTEIKSRLAKDIPVNLYDDTTYPNAHQDTIGEPIQLAYGRIYGATPRIVDTSLRKFKVAGHAIREFSAVRVYKDSKWTPVSFESTDRANAEFTLASADWDTGQDVSVDFIGKENPDGTLMENPVDVIADILDHVGETDLNTSSFTTAAARLETGSNTYGDANVSLPLSLYLYEPEDMLEVLGRINKYAGTYLFSDAAGQWRVGAFRPEAGEDLDSYSEGDYLQISEEYGDQDRVSKVTISYGIRTADEWSNTYTLEVTANQFIGTDKSALIEEIELPTDRTGAVQHFAQRHLLTYGKAPRFWSLSLPYKALTKLPGDQVRLVHDRTSLDAVVEILEVQHNFSGNVPTTTLYCGELHNYAYNAGYWVNASATLPSRFSGEAGYGTGADEWSSSWSDTIKTWARQNRGYWTDSNGFADPADPDSHLVSVWV